ncbi:serine/threonine-protein phosphatase 2A regulatory subunit B'' subunit alpha isoform X1 [Lagopus muta]|uniref:serine/threonine-protein phosphatase 2A regulatory subunit B'' subunit alpha isoform X1 n=2 Tax=Lagopus muta TaxID=64668 RepID=UPI00209DBAB0|nr:serine/threonine-protein phosphatase 2A regulatory subunit B'' subunit alpha isoform X1 [Lagopus muta]XP_048810303.1 serine/threonine-protein phosphatase 2A regulatory subunit B'' subunit alpha isoform X1 [Lagopus muta]XP_048810304.1 serine/threonine-protein phosphatase 2A regulatory subunit B'' subunit alpha isoform X1 [Lagopus muta]
MVNFEASLPSGICAMAATYRLMVTTVNCYSSVVIEQHFQHTVHYCTGTCQVFKQGVACIVAHHSVCAELGVQDANLDHKIPVSENGLALPGNEDYQQILLNNPRIKKGSLVQASGSLKDITGEAINLASGKIKEFSFEKLKNSSNHVAYRKGRKVRSESFSRRSFDFDMIYGHFSNDENSPPCGFLQSPSPVEKWQESNDAPEVSMNPMVPFSPHSFSDENFITQILEKHKLDGSSGGDIKVCLDILLKCSEDLKKCTDIIKHCIKKKSADSVSGGNSSDPLASSEMIYVNLMRRFSSYLKKLPFEFKPPGHKEAGDLGELVNCFHGLQQTPFSPIFGDEQPPRYEDIIQLPSSNAVPVRPPGDQCEVTSASQSIQTSTVSFTSNSLCSTSQENTVRAVKDACVLPQLSATSPPDCTPSTEVLYIEEESDGERVLEKTTRAKEKEDWESLKHSYQLSGSSDAIADGKAEPTRVGGELSHASEKSNLLKPVSDSVLRGSQAGISKGEQTCKIDKDEIDKLLLDLEHFSQKMESTFREPPPKESEPACLQVLGWQGRPVLPAALEPKSKPSDPTSPLSKIMETNGHKMEEDDRALLLRILESIEDFAQELVEFQTGKGSLSKEKEVMQILQETLSTPSQSLLAGQKSHAGAASRDSVPALIQQAPEVIKVQSKQEKKPGTSSPVPLNSVVSPCALPVNKATSSTPLSVNIPRFYFPKGLPNVCTNHEEIIARIEEAFTEFEDEKANICEMGKIAKICGCPLYWKAPMFSASGGQRTGCVSVHSFVSLWRKILRNCHDDASRFAYLVAKPSCGYLEQEDFIPLLQDVVETHPGLTFLKDAPEFHSRYITTVIQRIFYTVNRSWSGKITLTELRKSNFLQTLALLEEEDDINQITDYFSYEHFYVIYCKFWELDTDHDLYISQKDLARYSDQALSSRIIERIFSGAVVRGNEVQKEGRMSYADFVWLLISEEDKRNATSIEYWFRCMDLDGDGVLSMYELEYFYEEQCERMEVMGIEPLPFQDLLCQMLDLVKPEREGRVTLRDLKRCRMAHVFYNTFFNLEKYLDNEQRDPFAVQKDFENDGPEPSDWDRYAAEEYEILVAEESGNEQLQEGSFEEDYETDEVLSPSETGDKSN